MNTNTKSILGIVAALIALVFVGYLIFDKNETPATTPNKPQSPEATTETIKIGFIGPLTGELAYIGNNIKSAVEIAIEEINNNNTFNRQFEVIYEDGVCNGKDATKSANKLLSVDKVDGIIGGTCSGETLGIAPLVEQAKIPAVSPASTSPDVSDAGDYVFRVVPSDSFQGEYAANTIKETFGKQNVAVISCLNDWCQGVRKAFINKFETMGNIVADEVFNVGDTDLRSQLTKIKQSNPDAIYFIGQTTSSVSGIRQLSELGLDNLLVMGADTWSDSEIWEQIGEIGDGMIYSEPSNIEPPEWFVQKMSEKEKEINVYSARGYDATYILASALANSTNGTEAKDMLYKLKNYKGIADTYTFDENGDVINAIYSLKEIKDGKISNYGE